MKYRSLYALKNHVYKYVIMLKINDNFISFSQQHSWDNLTVTFIYEKNVLKFINNIFYVLYKLNPIKEHNVVPKASIAHN